MAISNLVAGRLQEKKGYYYIVLSLRENGKVKSKWLSTKLKVQRGNKRIAEQMLQEARMEYTKLQEVPLGGDMLFADFMLFWLKSIKGTIKETTYSSYEYSIRTVISPYFRELGVTMRDLDAEHIQDFYDEQLLRVKPNTVIKYHANIHKALRFAAKKKDKPYYRAFFMEEVERPSPNAYEANFLNESRMVQLVDEAAGTDLELPIILGGLYGLRRGEVIGLRYSRIDFAANTILIDHSVTHTKIDGKKRLYFNSPKSKASIRTLPLNPLLKEYLQHRKEQMEENKKLFGRAYRREYLDYVFVNPIGDIMRPNVLSEQFPKLPERLGFGKMRFHDLRHSCASIMIAKGVPMKTVQEWLGHSDYQTTANTYSHLEYKAKLEAAQTVNWLPQTVFGGRFSEQEQDTSLGREYA